MKKSIQNVSSSILSRLLQHSRENREDYQSLLIRYVGERFLFRLGQSDFKELFILKGAYLLTITLDDQTYRSTKDIDFLKTGESDSDALKEAIFKICSIVDPDDGVVFDVDSIILKEIREQSKYNGQRAKVTAFIGKARITLQIDIGVGDSIFPDPKPILIPSLLNLTTPEVESYPIETVIAEKLEAIISISFITSRMKDFYDIYAITSCMVLDYKSVQTAIKMTFDRRGTELPKANPPILSDDVLVDPIKQKQWNAFLRKIRKDQNEIKFNAVIHRLREFSIVLWTRKRESLISQWIPGRGWQ